MGVYDFDEESARFLRYPWSHECEIYQLWLGPLSVEISRVEEPLHLEIPAQKGFVYTVYSCLDEFPASASGLTVGEVILYGGNNSIRIHTTYQRLS